MSDRLPGPRGAANVRWARRMMRDVYGTLIALHEEFGDVAALGRGRLGAVSLFSPEAALILFAQGADTVSWHDAMAPLIPVDGETAIIVSDGDDHERRRRVVQPAFGRRKLDDTITMMSQEARRTFSTWTPGSEHETYVELRGCIRRIVIRALFGDDMGARADEFGDALEEPLRYINRPPWRRFDHEWPGTPYRRAMASRRAADAIVYSELDRRRALPDLESRVDLLSVLLTAHEDDALTDTEVRDQVVSLIAAGYDTTTAAAAWMVHFFATNPSAWVELQSEVRDVVGSSEPDASMLQNMPWLNGVVSETLRLGSPAYIAGRRVEAPFDVLGHTVPAGPLVFYVPYVTHRLESCWPNPLAFRPGRWVDGHVDHHEITPGSWIPFGGGSRRCLGLGFATTELKVLALELARAVSGSLVAMHHDVQPTGLASMMPEDGAPVTVSDS